MMCPAQRGRSRLAVGGADAQLCGQEPVRERELKRLSQLYGLETFVRPVKSGAGGAAQVGFRSGACALVTPCAWAGYPAVASDKRCVTWLATCWGVLKERGSPMGAMEQDEQALNALRDRLAERQQQYTKLTAEHDKLQSAYRRLQLKEEQGKLRCDSSREWPWAKHLLGLGGF